MPFLLNYFMIIMKEKRIILIIVFLLSIININAALPDIDDLTASSYGNNLILTWSYSFYGVCEENWQCTEWGSCINDEQTRICNDLNNCNTNNNKPEEIQTCISSYGNDKACTDECSSEINECVGSYGYRICSNYDEDDCLEWSPHINCNQDEICQEGNCLSSYGSYGGYGTGNVVRNIITGNSIKDSFKEALRSIIDFFKKLFRLEKIGAEISEIYSFEIYRNNILIDQGSSEKYCIKEGNNYNCRYDDNDLYPGDYSYHLKLLNATESKTSDIINIKICDPACFVRESPPIEFILPTNGSILNNNISEIILNTTLFNVSINVKNLANDIEINTTKDENSNLFIGKIELIFGKNILEAKAINDSSEFLNSIVVYRNEIQESCLDRDNDGFKDVSCGGNDCNDDTRSINPNRTENCDDKRDNNCNSLIDLDDPQCTTQFNSNTPSQAQPKNNREIRNEFQSKSIEDSDDDGLPDDWELAYFGNLKQTGNDDYDKDKITNLEEFKQGTNPKISNLESNDFLIGLIIFIIIIAAIATPVVFIFKKIKKREKMKLESQFTKQEHKQIYDYIHRARKNKNSDDEIKNNLINAGWEREEIDYLFNIRS